MPETRKSDKEASEKEERDRDAVLITTARAAFGPAGPGAAAIAELIVDLKRSLVAEQEATNRLTERIERLNQWLLGFTIVGTPIALVSLAIALVALIWKR
jgi:hypothetical protein